MIPDPGWGGQMCIIRSREAELCGRRPHDKEVLKNESLSDRRLYRTIHSDHRHGPDSMSRCAYDLVGSG